MYISGVEVIANADNSFHCLLPFTKDSSLGYDKNWPGFKVFPTTRLPGKLCADGPLLYVQCCQQNQTACSVTVILIHVARVTGPLHLISLALYTYRLHWHIIHNYWNDLQFS